MSPKGKGHIRDDYAAKLTATRLPVPPDDHPLVLVHSGVIRREDKSIAGYALDWMGSHHMYRSMRPVHTTSPDVWYQINTSRDDRGPARSIVAEWLGYEMQHRYEDLAAIQGTIRAHRPSLAIELGSAEGGFAALLADTLKDWDGQVLSVDRVLCPSHKKMAHEFPNLTLRVADVMVDGGDPAICAALARVSTEEDDDGAFNGYGVMLYCDNGGKMREMYLYAPHVTRGGLLGTHDYGTEVWPGYAALLMEHYGYVPVDHESYEALAHPAYYPHSLTRFWQRVESKGQPGDVLPIALIGG